MKNQKHKTKESLLINEINKDCHKRLSGITHNLEIALDAIVPYYKGKGSLHLIKAIEQAKKLSFDIDRLTGCALDFEKFFANYMREAEKIQNSMNSKD